jgi:hypothetical protein
VNTVVTSHGELVSVPTPPPVRSSAEAPRFGLGDVEEWVRRGIITREQADKIRALASEPRAGASRRFDLLTVAYYFGGITILLAYTLFMGRQWEQFSHVQQTAVSAFTVGVLVVLGYALRRRGLRLPGNLLIFAGTGILPLLVYSLEKVLGVADIASAAAYRDYYSTVAPSWVGLELASLAAAVVALWFTRFPLITLLIAHWSWFLSLDGARWLTRSSAWSWDDREFGIGLAVGLILLAVGVVTRERARQNYGPWLYIYGFLLTFGNTLALTARNDDGRQLLAVMLGLVLLGVGVRLRAQPQDSASAAFYVVGHLLVLSNASAIALRDEGLAGLAFLVLYLSVVAASVVLQSRIFLLFGALGCYGYVSYLAFKLFADSLGFPFVLGATGLAIVLSAVAYERVVRGRLERILGGLRSIPVRG